VLIAGAGAGALGLLAFVDVGATVAAHLGLEPGAHGTDLMAK
jgi:phosphopentomutase